MTSSFESFAVEGAWGAHVTPQAGVDLLGRYWTSTSRASLKVRAVTRRPIASVASARHATHDGRTDEHGGRITLRSGRARVLDPRSPTTAIDDPFGASVIGLVVGRIALTHLDEVAGYGAIAREVPTPWSIAGRVLLSVAADHELVADDRGITHATGAWAAEHDLPAVRRRARIAPIRLAGDAAEAAHSLAAAAWDGSDDAIGCAIGLTTPVGPVAVPGRWDADHGSAVVRRDVLARLAPSATGGACITLDRNADRHADEKVGLILRGTPALRMLPRSHPDADGHVGVVVTPERVTWWHGFASGTERTAQRRAA